MGKRRVGWCGVWESPWRSLIEQTTGKDWGEKTFNLVIWVQIKGIGNVFVVDFKAIFDHNDSWYNHYQHLSFLLKHRHERLQENLEMHISSTLCIHNYSSCNTFIMFQTFLDSLGTMRWYRIELIGEWVELRHRDSGRKPVGGWDWAEIHLEAHWTQTAVLTTFRCVHCPTHWSQMAKLLH